MKQIVFINYDKTETGVKIEVSNDHWQLFQDTMIKGGGDEYQIIFEDNANQPQTSIDPV